MTFPDAAAGNRPTVAIIIPVHNKATITRQCLEALLAAPDDGVDREIVVVDDGSRDGTPAMLEAFGERIRVIRNETALGFAGACNAGAAATESELLVLLNNDTIPTPGWLAALVSHALLHPAAAVVGAKLLFPNDTVQHAGVVFGLDLEPHHIYAGFPASHPATHVTRPFQAVTAACALFRREPWDELGGLCTDYRNGWEDVDYCMRAGEAGYEIHYCAESVVYHFESATRDLLSATERANRALFNERWRDKIDPDDFGYYWADELISAVYGARYPIQLSLSPLLAGVVAGDNDRQADKLLYERARQVMILLRNNIILNVRVQDAEARAAASERRLAEVLAVSDEGGRREAEATALPPPDSMGEPPPRRQEPIADPAAHQIVGRVEEPGSVPDVVIDGRVRVSGWASSRAGGTRVETFVDDEPRGEIVYGLPKPEIAALYPELPEGVACGFAGEVPVEDLPDGWHTLGIRISSVDGGRADLATRFEIDHDAYETGRLLGRLEAPARGTRLLARELLMVSGWALSPSGIGKIEIAIDGASRGAATYGSLRPDIARIAGKYPDADHCGFHGVISIYGLDEGAHDLRVTVTAHDGQVQELPQVFTVDSASVIDGGLPAINREYASWLQKRAAIREESGGSVEVVPAEADGLEFGAVVVLDGGDEDALHELAASLRAQQYGKWRLTLVDRGASAAVTALASQLASEDPRIAYQRVPDGTSLAAAWNAGGQQGTADWVSFLTSDVRLAPEAFATVASTLAGEAADIVYSDDDRRDPATGQRWNPFFKPDWSPYLLLSMPYFGPLTLYRRALLDEIGWLREGYEGAARYDLALRAAERATAIRHLPEVLVTTVERAPAQGVRWPATTWNDAERDALRAALDRRGVRGIVERGLHPGRWRVRYPFREAPGVTVVIPTGGNLDLLRRCVDDLLYATNYPDLEIVIVDNSLGADVAAFVAGLATRSPRIRHLAVPIKPFNFSALINAALPLVETPYVLLLNDDIGVIEADWLTAMVELATRPDVGIVGAKLLYPDDTIQHAGVVLGPFEGSIHVFKRFHGDDPGFFDLPDVTRDVSAVTFACTLIDRAVFDTIGGLDDARLPVAFNDTDYCLRAREAGFAVVYTPHAALYHHESVTKTVIAHPQEVAFVRNRWRDVIAHDPYYNPNLSRRSEDARLNTETLRAR